MSRHTSLKLLREPLFHFLLFGAGIFLVYSVVKGPDEVKSNRIVIEETQVLRLAEQFQRTWMRPPIRQELKDLVEDFVKEEILYREAQALGLDQDDLVIRRRLSQKMEFLNEELTEPQAPTDAELQAYFYANQERFRRSDRFSFQQVYIKPHNPARDAKRIADEMLTRLNSNSSISADLKSIGDVTMLPFQLDAVARREIANTFGKGFTKHIDDAPFERWSGPYESVYGLHLVRIMKRETGGLPTMAEIRPILEREWNNDRRNEAKDHFYQTLRARYDIEIRLPEDTTGKTLAER